MDALNSSSSNASSAPVAYKDMSGRYDKLYEIYKSSGCKIQVCKSLLAMMPDARIPNDSLIADKAAIKLASAR